MSIYGPRDRWPEHPKPWWRDTLAYARQKGWSLEHPSGHWGRISCPGDCAVAIFGTGRGGESVARSARRKVERCRHAKGSALAGIVDHLDAAQRLTDAAAVLVRRRERQTQIEEMLMYADAALDAVEESGVLDQIDDMPTDAEIQTAGVALVEADTHLDQAARVLPSISIEIAKPLRRRLRALRRHIDDIRARVAGVTWNVVEIESGRRRDADE